MTEKNLIKKLNNCKNVNPDAEWLNSNRELFLAQISNSGANKLNAWEIFCINLKCVAKAASQPVFALGVFFIVLVVSSIFTHRIFSHAKPNDSLYIARIISEKAKLNTVLDPGERDKLAVKFATGHARDISTVLANPEFNTEANSQKVEKLNESFSKEIETAKNKIVKINERAAAQTQNQNQSGQASSTPTEEDVISIAIDEDYIESNGIEITGTETTEVEVDLATSAVKKEDTKEDTKDKDTAKEETTDLASSTDEVAKLITESTETPKKPSDQIIEEAIKLFENKDYENVINKLNEINDSIK